MNKKLISFIVSMGLMTHTAMIYAEPKEMKTMKEEYTQEQIYQFNIDSMKEFLAESYDIEATDLTPINLEVSFYTDLDCENGFGPINSLGESLKDGMVANNKLPFGTKIYVEGMGIKEVRDRGSEEHFSDIGAIDVFVPRLHNESDNAYYKRVNKMGRFYVKSYIIKTEDN